MRSDKDERNTGKNSQVKETGEDEEKYLLENDPVTAFLERKSKLPTQPETIGPDPEETDYFTVPEPVFKRKRVMQQPESPFNDPLLSFLEGTPDMEAVEPLPIRKRPPFELKKSRGSTGI